MERTSLRAWRRFQQYRIWRNRIKHYANLGHEVYDNVTGKNFSPRDWKKYRGEHWMKILKTTATPCSCWMCANYLYDRKEVKRETRRILGEQLDE